MTLDDAKTYWHSQDELDKPMSDTEILTLVHEQSRAFDKKIRTRDRRELLAAAFAFLAFGAIAVFASSWFVLGGAALVMAGSVFIGWTLRRARANNDGGGGAEPSVAERLRIERGKMDKQIRLLESVLWWYIAPLMTGGALVALGRRGATWYGAAHVAAFVLLGAVVYWMNQRAVRKELRPERERLSRLLRQVEEG